MNLDGIGRQEMNNGVILDGLFSEGMLSLGFKYNFEDNRYVYGYYQNKNDDKILRSGKGFPFNLMGKTKKRLFSLIASNYYMFIKL